MLTSHLFTHGTQESSDRKRGGVGRGHGCGDRVQARPRRQQCRLGPHSATWQQVSCSTATRPARCTPRPPMAARPQKWLIAGSDFGSSTVRNVATGRCLDSSSTRVYTSWCNGGSFQKWFVQERGFGAVVLRNLATGYVLDSNAARSVYALPENGGSYQKVVGTARLIQARPLGGTTPTPARSHRWQPPTHFRSACFTRMSGLHQPCAKGQGHGLCAVMAAGLHQDARDMRLDGGFAEDEVFANRGVGHALRDQCQHL